MFMGMRAHPWDRAGAGRWSRAVHRDPPVELDGLESAPRSPSASPVAGVEGERPWGDRLPQIVRRLHATVA